MGNGIGYEHYFLNYYLYLPYSKIQEEMTIFESVKYLLDLNLIELKDHKSKKYIDVFFRELSDVLLNMKNYSKCEVDQIKKELRQINKIKIILNYTEINNMISILKNFNIEKNYKNISKNDINKSFIGSKEKLNDNINNNLSNSDLNDISKRIIYGDFINKNESVEVFLHQRTMKKVKYKKRDFSEVHQFDIEKLEKIKNKLKEIYSKEGEDGNIFLLYNIFHHFYINFINLLKN